MATTVKTKSVKKTVAPAKATRARATQNKKDAAPKKPVTASTLSISVVGIDGKSAGTMSLPKELFGVDVNEDLLAQAVRVYRANQREGGAHTKTRGEVEGSTRKIYKQKGTGRARHGSIRAPIFVGGGISFGPRKRDYRLSLSKKMKRAALASALTKKFGAKQMVAVDGMESLKPKTKLVAGALQSIDAKGTVLLAVSADDAALVRASKNIGRVDTIRAVDMHPYAILTHKTLVITKKALGEVKERFV